MSKVPVRLRTSERSCTSKVRYESRKEARRVILLSRFRRARVTYACHHCGGWHIATKRQRS